MENILSPLIIDVQCEDCNERFKLSSEDENKLTLKINHKKEFYSKSDGQSIFLTYYDCPRCGRRYFVQIDNFQSLNMFKSVMRQFIKLSKLKRKGKTIPKNQSDKFKKDRNNLLLYRNKLMQEYTGKLIHNNDTDEDFELRFSKYD